MSRAVNQSAIQFLSVLGATHWDVLLTEGYRSFLKLFRGANHQDVLFWNLKAYNNLDYNSKFVKSIDFSPKK